MQQKIKISLKNWAINQRYTSKLKKIARFLIKQLCYFYDLNSLNNKNLLKEKIHLNMYTLISLLDKCLKKKIYHFRYIQKRKTKINKLYVLLKN